MGSEIIIFKCPHCGHIREVGIIIRGEGDYKTEYIMTCLGGCKKDGEEEV